MKKIIVSSVSICILSLILFISVAASSVVRQGSGANAGALQSIVDLFRADLGGVLNPNNGQTFINGRREVNWDTVPDNLAEPNNLPVDFFNINSPRGLIFNAIEDATGAALNQFAVSATSTSGTAVRFGNLNAGYSSIFQTFSAQRLFIARNTHLLEVRFLVPGTSIPATVNGFGLVFADVDSAFGGNRSVIRVYSVDGRQLAAASAPVMNNGLSFVGISFNAGERIASVVIESGNAPLSAANNDGTGGVDVVAMDDFIYGEPRASQYHASDFDGDGTSDLNVFRPSTGTFFVLNSGSGTLTTHELGEDGDMPIEADLDGDKCADIAVWRPSTGVWFFKRSSDGSSGSTLWGTPGDRPVPGDYDKDGKTDLAVWRPSNGVNFIMRSSTGVPFAIQWGAAGDIPVAAAAQ